MVVEAEGERDETVHKIDEEAGDRGQDVRIEQTEEAFYSIILKYVTKGMNR